MSRGEKEGEERQRRHINWSLLLVGILVMAVLGGILSALYGANSWVRVEQGYAMIIVDTTKPEGQKLSAPILGPIAGFYLDGFKKMIGQQYPVFIYYATEVYSDTVSCFSSDQLEMAITIQMRWQLNTSRLVALYQSYPRLDFESSAIDSIMEKNIRLVTKNFTALETIEHREIVSQQMQQAVLSGLQTESSLQGALSYLTFDMKNIGYPGNYTKAIEDKLVAQQKELQAEYERERIIILANATAQQIILQSQGEAQAKIIVANSTKQAIQMILQASGVSGDNATRIAELYLWVETLKQIAPYVKYFFLWTGSAQTPYIMIPTNSTSP
jgi:regulator of protease activity HflC (stomatin/prohibitin superfamily)